MKVGCVKEIKNTEFRVGLTPGGARGYCAAGHTVYVEKGAGVGSGFGVGVGSGFGVGVGSGFGVGVEPPVS